MIEKLQISNFKSIKDLQLNCKRINLFIGEPNTGKSNILEALALFALPISDNVNQLVRIGEMSNLFFDNDPSDKIKLTADSISLEIVYDLTGGQVIFNFPENFQMRFSEIGKTIMTGSYKDYKIHPYFFKSTTEFYNKRIDFLSTPDGNNLFSLLQSNKNLRLKISEFIQDRGFKLTLRQAKSEIEISKEVDNVLTTYPYIVISDTLQRILFYLAAIESNREETSLIFEEPESNVFPYYTKFLAEKIALDDVKQYFLTTHNPYFLQSIIEKTPIRDLSVNVVQMNDRFESIVTSLSDKGIEKTLDLNSDVFSKSRKTYLGMTYFECYADEAFLTMLEISKKESEHSVGRSKVCFKLNKDSNSLGLVDEDPHAAQEPYLKYMFSLQASYIDENVILITDKKLNNRLIVLKPDLERFSLKIAKDKGIDLRKRNNLSTGFKSLHNELMLNRNSKKKRILCSFF